MSKGISDFSLRAAAVVVMTGAVFVFLFAAAGRAPAADLSTGNYGDGKSGVYVCGQNVDSIQLFDSQGRPTVPGRTPMFFCVTGTTLLPGEIPPSPEYCCH